MKKPEVGVEQDGRGERFLAITCPDCGKTTRYPFAGLEPGLQLPCACGVAFNFSEENYRALQERFGLGETDESVH